MLLFKLVIIILLLFVVTSLFSALYFLNKDSGDSTRILKSLSLRIGLSLFIVILLFIGSWLGWITPHGIGG